jgi:hypothetical protein
MKKQPSPTAKNHDGNIDSSETKVMIAVYTYSHLKYSWRLFEIRRLKDRMIFEVD